jgi:hypothetical protein
VEPDNRPGGAEQLSVFGTENCTTTGGKNKFGSLEKFCEHGGFTLAKAGFAFRRKNLRDGAARPLLDDAVGIQPFPAELFGKPGSNAGFATGPITDEKMTMGAFSFQCSVFSFQRSVFSVQCSAGPVGEFLSMTLNLLAICCFLLAIDNTTTGDGSVILSAVPVTWSRRC